MGFVARETADVCCAEMVFISFCLDTDFTKRYFDLHLTEEQTFRSPNRPCGGIYHPSSNVCPPLFPFACNRKYVPFQSTMGLRGQRTVEIFRGTQTRKKSCTRLSIESPERPWWPTRTSGGYTIHRSRPLCDGLFEPGRDAPRSELQIPAGTVVHRRT